MCFPLSRYSDDGADGGLGGSLDGDYDDVGSKRQGERPSPKKFLAQLGAWLGVVMTSKIILCCIILSQANNLLSMSAAILDSVRCKNASSMVELLVVMLMIPTCLNAFQFYVTDGFIKFGAGGKSKAGEDKDSDGGLLLDPKQGSSSDVGGAGHRAAAMGSSGGGSGSKYAVGSPKHEKSPLIKAGRTD